MLTIDSTRWLHHQMRTTWLWSLLTIGKHSKLLWNTLMVRAWRRILMVRSSLWMVRIRRSLWMDRFWRRLFRWGRKREWTWWFGDPKLTLDKCVKLETLNKRWKEGNHIFIFSHLFYIATPSHNFFLLLLLTRD